MAREPILIIEAQPEAELNLPRLGRVRVHEGGRLFHRQLEWRRRRPLAANYRAFANSAMPKSLKPTHSEAEIDRLPERQRRKLMRTVITAHGEDAVWRRLIGSFLSADERFFAVMQWAAEREQAEKRRALAATREQLQRRLHEICAIAGGQPTLYASSVSNTVQAGLALTGLMRQMDSINLWTRGPLNLSRDVKTAYGLDSLNALIKAFGLDDTAAATRCLGVASGLSATLRLPGFGLAGDELSRALAATSPHLHMTKELQQLREMTAMEGLWRGEVGAISGLVRMAGRDDLYSGLAGIARPHALSEMAPLLWGSFGASAAIDSLLRIGSVDLAFRSPFADLTLAKLAEPLRWFDGHFADLSAFMRKCENDPLWLLLSLLDFATTRLLFGLARTEVEAVVLAALTEVVLEGRLLATMRAELRKAPYLNTILREWLDDALASAAAGQWVKAIPPLILGLEGVLQSIAAERSERIRQRRGKIIVLNRRSEDHRVPRPLPRLRRLHAQAHLRRSRSRISPRTRRQRRARAGDPYRRGPGILS
ncbi:MAG: hypothetical protein ACLP8S_23865 [Solirubrobacteraceae bacterium]